MSILYSSHGANMHPETSSPTDYGIEKTKARLASMAESWWQESKSKWEQIYDIYSNPLAEIPEWYWLLDFGQRDGKKFFFEWKGSKATSICLNMPLEKWNLLLEIHWERLIKS